MAAAAASSPVHPHASGHMSTSLREAIERHRQDASVSPPPITDVSYLTENDWIDDISTILCERGIVSLSMRQHSFVYTVMGNGMEYNPDAVLGYLFTRWEGIIDRLISHGVHTQERYRSLSRHLSNRVASLKRRLTDNVETGSSSITRSMRYTYELRNAMSVLSCVVTNLRRLEQTLSGLMTTRCVSKTPLFLADGRSPPPSIPEDELPITLHSTWPDLFPEEWPSCTGSFDDRKVFVGSLVQGARRWSNYRTEAIKYSAQRALPSGWLYDSSLMYVNRPGYYPRELGKNRFRVGLLLAALDSIATQVFISYEEYSNWTPLIRDEIRAVAGSPPLPPPPPMPAINAEEMTISGPVAEDDLDPVSLEAFKEGDKVFKMRCCRNKILKESIQGILASGRTPKCPLCRTGLLV